MRDASRARRGVGGEGLVTITRVPVPDLCCLWAETDTTPMNVALVGTFDEGPLVDDDGEVALARIRCVIAAHLDQAPMLRKVLRRTRPGQGRPVWVDAVDFSIEDQVVMARPQRAFTDVQEFWTGAQLRRRAPSTPRGPCGGSTLCPASRTTSSAPWSSCTTSWPTISAASP